MSVQEGLGSSSGISLLFSRTKQLTWGMTTFKSGELVITLLAQTKAWAVASGIFSFCCAPGIVRSLTGYQSACYAWSGVCSLLWRMDDKRRC